MAGRSAAPKRTKAEPATRSRHPKKIEYEPVADVSVGRGDNEVTKLISCLAEWTREMQAVRAAPPTPPPTPRRRPRAQARRGVTKVPRTPAYPRGNPLTESMEFTDRDGTAWLAYIESTVPPPSTEPTHVTVLPGRHLRFDSLTESRFTCVVPAGSPFLPAARLQALMDEARPELLSASAAGTSSGLGLGAMESSSRGVRDDWTRPSQQVARWGSAQRRRSALSRHVVEWLAGAVDTMQGLAGVLLSHRPARP